MEPVSAAALLEASPTAWLSTGCPALDACLQGGIPNKGITEIAGESAAGKTQLCLQLLLQCQLAAEDGGLGGGALYMVSEGAASTRRLAGLADTFKTRHSLPAEVDPMAKVFVEEVSDVDAVNRVLAKVPVLLRRAGVKLLVIDSVTALFRGDAKSSQVAGWLDVLTGPYAQRHPPLLQDYKARARVMCALAARLRGLAQEHSVCVVTVNQATGVMSGDAGLPRRDVEPILTGAKVRPALGLVWSNCVNSRVLLSKKGTVPIGAVPSALFVTAASVGAYAAPSDAEPNREMRLVHSPWAAPRVVRYGIAPGGVFGVPE